MVDPPAAGASAGQVLLGGQVRAARLARGVGLRQLAARLGVSPGTLSAVEHGRTGLSAVRLGRIAALLDVPVEQLLLREPDPSPDGVLPGSPASPGSWRSYPPLVLDPPLAGALAAFVEFGYAGASMRDIGRRAGLSVPGLYHHHPSKHDLLVALLDLTMADLLARSLAARAEGGDPAARFRLLVECLALFHTHRRELGFVGASEMRSLQPAARARITGARRQQQLMVDEEVAAGCRAGVFGTRRPAEAARAVVTMCTALPQWFSTTGPAAAEQVAGQYVEFALGVVGFRGPG